MGFEGVAAGDAGADLVVVGVDAVDVVDGLAAAGVAVAHDGVAVVFFVHFHEHGFLDVVVPHCGVEAVFLGEFYGVEHVAGSGVI